MNRSVTNGLRSIMAKWSWYMSITLFLVIPVGSGVIVVKTTVFGILSFLVLIEFVVFGWMFQGIACEDMQCLRARVRSWRGRRKLFGWQSSEEGCICFAGHKRPSPSVLTRSYTYQACARAQLQIPLHHPFLRKVWERQDPRQAPANTSATALMPLLPYC